MGFLSKLFGNKDPFDDGKDQLEKKDPDAVDLLAEMLRGQDESRAESRRESRGSVEDPSSRDTFSDSAAASGQARYNGSGGSAWPQTPPAEENQYTFKGSYVDYFLHVFREDFPDYELRVEQIRYGYATLIHLSKNGREELCVELMSENSAVQVIRSECKRNGIRYLRFYYNHRPWWNTRRYVTGRVQDALNTSAELFWHR